MTWDKRFKEISPIVIKPRTTLVIPPLRTVYTDSVQEYESTVRPKMPAVVPTNIRQQGDLLRPYPMETNAQNVIEEFPIVRHESFVVPTNQYYTDEYTPYLNNFRLQTLTKQLNSRVLSKHNHL